MELIVAQYVALRHNVLRLITSDHGPFLQDLDGVEMLVCITTGQEDFAETSSTEHAQEFEIIRFQPFSNKTNNNKVKRKWFVI